ncbi:MAG TPA: hypothetical protein VG986_08900 [Pseudolabrys sp.]|nr:hypothetical protein [Pseudolabrys sp.]
MADDWVRLGMAIMLIAFVSVCLYAGSDRARLAQPGAFAVVQWR